MTTLGDTRRANAARSDLQTFMESKSLVGLVLLGDDHVEQPPIEGQVLRMNFDSVLFRHDGLEEELPLGIIAKRVHGNSIVSYGELR